MGTQQSSRSQANRKQASVKQTNTELDFIFKRSIFWRPSYIAQSAWLEHIPFAFWLVETLRPRKIVELGTHYGSSYFSFCQAITKLDLETQCYAVDTWGGDEHAGQYGEEVYRQVSEHNQQHYSDFSTLVRSTFDQALKHFPQGSIDLLHIDGLHTLEAVRHDFESWLPKLSERAVVIMHDTNVRERGFGVFQLLDELKQQYPHFEFAHGHGLGVIGVGSEQSSEMMSLYDLSGNASATRQVQEVFSRLGKACGDSWENNEIKRQMVALQATQQAETQDVMEQQALERGYLAERITAQHHTLKELEGKLQQHADLSAELAQLKQYAADMQTALNRCEQQRDQSIESQQKLETALAGTRQELTQRVAECDRIAHEQQRALQQQIDELTSALTTAHQQQDELSQTLATEARHWQQQKQTLTEAHDRLQTQCDALTADLAASHAKLEEYESAQQIWQTREQELVSILDARADEVTHLSQTLAENAQESDKQNNELEQTRDQLAVLLKRHHTEQAQLGNRVSELVKQNEILEANISERFRELAIMTRHTEQLTRELQQKELQLQKAKDRAQNLKQSVSWKLTAPVRALGRTFKESPTTTPSVSMSNAERIAASGLFDELWYLHRYPEVADSGLSAIEHFIQFGADKGYSPSELFDTRWYLHTYADVAQGAINPLLHYILHGKAEQRQCLPDNMR